MNRSKPLPDTFTALHAVFSDHVRPHLIEVGKVEIADLVSELLDRMEFANRWLPGLNVNYDQEVQKAARRLERRAIAVSKALKNGKRRRPCKTQPCHCRT